MAQAFYPVRTISVPASCPPHPKGTTYEVAVGNEHWGNGDMKSVYKVQIAYEGKISGRKAPSYPEGTDDFERVMRALRDVKAGKGEPGRGKILSTRGDNVAPSDFQ